MRILGFEIKWVGLAGNLNNTFTRLWQSEGRISAVKYYKSRTGGSISDAMSFARELRLR